MTITRHAGPFALAVLLGGCPGPRPSVECIDESSCGLAAGGQCLVNGDTGHQFCAYPDPACPGGLRWSDFDVEPGISGACVGGPDAGVDAPVIEGDAGVGEWGQPEYVLNVNTAADELTPSASADHLSLYFSRGGNVFVTTRANTTALWGLATMVPALSDAGAVELSPEVAPNGLELYLTINNRLHRSTRATPTSAWTTPTLAFTDAGRSPALADAGRALYYVGSGWAIQRRTRTSLTDPWSEPVTVPIPGSPTYDAVTVSADDRTLLLSSAINNDQPQVIELTRAGSAEPWGNLKEAATLTRLQPTPRDCDFFADGNVMYCALSDGTNYNTFIVRRRL